MHRKWDWQVIIGWAAMLWLMVVIVGYYVMHKPVSPTTAYCLSLFIWRILIAGGIISIGGGLGRRLLSNPPLNPLAMLSVQGGLGLGLLSLGILAVGIASGLYLWVSLLAILIFAVFLRQYIFAWWKDWFHLWCVY